MISEDNKMFCAEIMSAARKMGVGCSGINNAGKWAFTFSDMGVMASGEYNEDKQEALLSACQRLQHNWTSWQKK